MEATAMMEFIPDFPLDPIFCGVGTPAYFPESGEVLFLTNRNDVDHLSDEEWANLNEPTLTVRLTPAPKRFKQCRTDRSAWKTAWGTFAKTIHYHNVRLFGEEKATAIVLDGLDAVYNMDGLESWQNVIADFLRWGILATAPPTPTIQKLGDSAGT
jgi:hypothetical protein